MSDPLNYATLRIGNNYNTSRSSLSKSLELLSSGIRFRAPKDGVSEFMAVERINQDNRGYAHIKRGLSRAMATMNTAEEIGTMVVNDLSTLKQLTHDYWKEAPGSLEREVAEREFNTISTNLNTILGSAFADGKELIQNGTVMNVMLDPNDVTRTLSISYDANDVADASTLTINGGADYDSSLALIETEYRKASSYLSKTSGYIHSISSHLRLTDSVIENNTAMASTLNEIDDATEMSRYVSQDIRAQASISMLSQANMIRGGVLKLLE